MRKDVAQLILRSGYQAHFAEPEVADAAVKDADLVLALEWAPELEPQLRELQGRRNAMENIERDE